MKIAEISIKRPTLVIVLFIILILGGILSYTSLNYEMLPKFSPSVVSVVTVYPGASPGEVENTVTKKIEDAVSSMENIKKIDSKSYEGVSLVTITLNSGTNVDYALNDAQRKINAILAKLPDDVDPPSLNKFSLDDLPILTISASSNMDESAFYDLVDQRIAPAISRVDGVAQVKLIGGQEREIQVNVDANKLEGYGLSLLQVQQAILSSNLDFPTGSVQTRERDILIRLSGKYKNVYTTSEVNKVQGVDEIDTNNGYTLKTSISSVNSNTGSYFWDKNTNLLYIHTSDDDTPSNHKINVKY